MPFARIEFYVDLLYRTSVMFDSKTADKRHFHANNTWKSSDRPLATYVTWQDTQSSVTISCCKRHQRNETQSETYGRLRPRCYQLVNSTKHTRRLWFCLFAPLSENMTSSTKPEVHNVSHCRQSRTEPRPKIARAEKHWRNLYVWFFRYSSGQTDRHAAYNTSHL